MARELLGGDVTDARRTPGAGYRAADESGRFGNLDDILGGELDAGVRSDPAGGSLLGRLDLGHHENRVGGGDVEQRRHGCFEHEVRIAHPGHRAGETYQLPHLGRRVHATAFWRCDVIGGEPTKSGAATPDVAAFGLYDCDSWDAIQKLYSLYESVCTADRQRQIGDVSVAVGATLPRVDGAKDVHRRNPDRCVSCLTCHDVRPMV